MPRKLWMKRLPAKKDHPLKNKYTEAIGIIVSTFPLVFLNAYDQPLLLNP